MARRYYGSKLRVPPLVAYSLLILGSIPLLRLLQQLKAAACRVSSSAAVISFSGDQIVVRERSHPSREIS